MNDGIDKIGNDAAARENLRVPEPPSDGADASRGTPAIDPVTGEVSGTGSGTGGSSRGEDYDDDQTAGSNSAR